MTLNKKTIIYIVAAIVVIAAVSGGTILVLGAINKKDASNSKSTSAESSVDSLRKEADKAKMSSNTEKAKELLLEAQKQNDALPKTDETTNTSVDIEAQLYLLEHTDKKK